MQRVMLFVIVVLVVGVLGGCSSESPQVPANQDDGGYIRKAESDNLTFKWHDASDGVETCGIRTGWAYINKYTNAAELVTNTHDNSEIHIFYENSNTWSSGGTIDVGADVEDDANYDILGDWVYVFGVTGFRSTTANDHTPSRMLVTFGDVENASRAYVAVYKGLNSATRWDYWGTWDLEAEANYDPNYIDLDIAPDGEYIVVATLDGSNYRARIWNSSPGGNSVANFVGSHVATITPLSTLDYYGGGVCVEMGAYNHNATDHNFVYSVPGNCTIYSYRQDNATTWTYVASKTVSAPAMVICNENYHDHLLFWDEQDYTGVYLQLGSGATFGSELDTFGAWGNKSASGGVNGIGWITGDVSEPTSGTYYIEAGIQSAYDAYVEIFGNY